MANHQVGNLSPRSLVIITLVSLVCFCKTLEPASACAQQKPVKTLIESTCTKCAYRDECIESFKADPRSANADLNGLVRIAVEKAHVRLVEAVNISTAFFSNCTNYRTWGFLQFAKGNFESAETDMHQVMKLIDECKFQEAYSHAETAHHTVCETETPQLEVIGGLACDMYRLTMNTMQLVNLLVP